MAAPNCSSQRLIRRVHSVYQLLERANRPRSSEISTLTAVLGQECSVAPVGFNEGSAGDTKTIESGHWFFHTGRHTMCAEGVPRPGRSFTIHLRAEGATPTPAGPQHFASLQAAKDWLAGYFGVPVVDARVRGMPRPADL